MAKKKVKRVSNQRKRAKAVGKKVSPKPTVYKLRPGDSAPDFLAAATGGKTLSLNDFRDRVLVLYFYPKDNTPGCTLEGHDFRNHFTQFKRSGAEVVGVSRDSLKSHEGFRAKCDFPFELLSDESGEICKAFDVIQMKRLYGRKFRGIERSTFVIQDGKIAREWRKLKVAGHAEEVLEFIKGLGK